MLDRCILVEHLEEALRELGLENDQEIRAVFNRPGPVGQLFVTQRQIVESLVWSVGKRSVTEGGEPRAEELEKNLLFVTASIAEKMGNKDEFRGYVRQMSATFATWFGDAPGPRGRF